MQAVRPVCARRGRARCARTAIRARSRACALALAVAAIAVGSTAPAALAAEGGSYREIDLVSNVPGAAALTDPNLVNAWGLAFSPTSPAWVADNGADVATLYRGGVAGTPPSIVPLVVSIPGGAPTGMVFNPTSGFVVHAGLSSGPARFLFASESGAITGWSPAVPPPPPSTAAQVAVSSAGAIYKGLALAVAAGGSRLYASDFHNGRIDVWDAGFTPVVLPPGAFSDPALPSGFAPFNIQEIGGRLYVTYAKQDADAEDDVAGPGNGYLDVYDTDGVLLRRLVSAGRLNSPWGLAVAPRGFGRFSGALLVGNFGDGRIHAYDPFTGAFLGTILRGDGAPLEIDGLWALRFGNGVIGSTRTLLFTAGPDDETNGLFGEIRTGDEDH